MIPETEQFPTPILEVIVGSTLHGTFVDDGLEDLDLMAIVIETPSQFIGFNQHDTWVHRTKPQGVRSEAGDVDLSVYGLRKYLSLVLGGNPTMLLALFAPKQFIKRYDVRGLQLQELAPHIVSKRAFNPFRGYMRQQHERLLGLRGQRNVTRPELVSKYGFDCYLADTEFLTHRGWLLYDEIDNDDLLGTINKRGEVEFQFHTDRVKKSYTGQLLHGRTRYSEWLVTPNHRMWVSKARRIYSQGKTYVESQAEWGFRTAGEVKRGVWHQRISPSRRETEYDIPDSYLKLIGAFVSEGCVGNRRNDGSASVLRFEQKDGGRLHEIMEAVAVDHNLRSYTYPKKRLGVTIWTLADREVAKDVEKTCGKGCHNKRLPPWFIHLSSRQADVLLNALLAGDGTPYATKDWVYYTVNCKLADDVQTLALIAGRRSLIWGPYPDAGYIFQVFIKDAGEEVAAFNGANISVVEVINKNIVCFTVPNEILITRRNGRVSIHGNTKYAGHIVRLGLQGKELLTTGKLTLPMPEEDRELVVAVRNGRYSLAGVSELIIQAEDGLDEAFRKSPLSEQPDRAKVEAWMIRTYLESWS